MRGLNEHHYDISSALEAIDGIKYPGGYRNIGTALELVRNKLYNESDRHGRTKMLIVVTRGRSHDLIVGPAQRLRDSGVTVFGVGTGRHDDEDMRQLREVATNPDSWHVYKLGLDSLDTVATSIKYRVCRGKLLCPLLSRFISNTCNLSSIWLG